MILDDGFIVQEYVEENVKNIAQDSSFSSLCWIGGGDLPHDSELWKGPGLRRRSRVADGDHNLPLTYAI